MATTADTSGGAGAHDSGSRRDFLVLTGTAMTLVGGALALWPMINSLNPAADTLAASTTTVDLSSVEVGQAITVSWRGSPVFIRRRTEAEIEQARSVDVEDLPDPATDESRTTDAEGNVHPQWLIMVGVCTHLGCIPLGQKSGDRKGDYGGWFCPCHGSHYDTAGRIRKGPAPENLPVPAYSFVEEEENVIRIG